MNEDNKAKLEELVYQRLAMAMNHADGSEEQKVFMEEAMEAIDRELEWMKFENSCKEKREELKWNRILKILEISGSILLVPTMNYMFNMKFAKEICHFEKDYTFTTTAGRSLGKLFRK